MRVVLVTMLGVPLALGLAGCGQEQPGPRLRRECTSLVNEVLKQDETVKKI